MFPIPLYNRNNIAAMGKTPWYLQGGITKANCLISYQPKGAASAAAALVNLANPGTYDASNGTAYPAWDTGVGWTFVAASTQFLNIGGGTGPILSADLSVLIRLDPDGSGDRYALGATGNTTCLGVLISAGNKPDYYAGGGRILVATTSVTADKVIGFTYTAAGAAIAYLNGVSDGTGTNNQTISADTDAVGRRNTVYFEGIIVALAVYDTVLTPTQVGLVTTAMLAL